MKTTKTSTTCSKPVGTWATLLLPLGEDDRIDFDRLKGELEYIAASGVDGVYSNGTAGEFYAQSEEEFDRVHEIVADVCTPAGLPFQVGASHTGAPTTLSRIRRGKKWGPSAFQVILPDWVPLSNEEAIRFLVRLADEAGEIPLVLYNPPHAKRVLAAADFLELAEAVPSLIGLKVGDGDAAWYDAMQPVMRRLSVFVPGHHLAFGFSRGAHGAYSNVACLSPRGARHWSDQMKVDLPGALALQRRIEAFFNEHLMPLRTGRWYCNHAFDKLLAAAGGWAPVGTRLRWPYNWFDPAVAADLGRVARRELPELFENL